MRNLSGAPENPVEAFFDVAFPVCAGGEPGLVEPDLVVAAFEVGFLALGEDGVRVVSVAQEEAHGVHSSRTRKCTRPLASPPTIRC